MAKTHSQAEQQARKDIETMSDPKPAAAPVQQTVATDNGKKPPKESKEERFRRLIEPRVSKVLASLINVERLGNKNQYSYTHEERDKVIAALERGLESVKRAFNGGAKTGTLFSL